MTRHAVLTKKDIKRAKELREQGKSNREIALFFHVGKTTIWENVYATEPRVRTYKKIINDRRPSCPGCGIKLTRDVKRFCRFPTQLFHIPSGFRMGNICLGCYLKSKGLTHMDLVND